MKKQLLKPEDWKSFERLCKKLWGEIWEIPHEIKMNGRAGQAQHGVDIWGIPKGESGIWGIQCKGKDAYTGSKLTRSEIDREIENAKNFQPPLEVFIIATTSNKDSDIEEYVRHLDVSNRAQGQFKIHLYCWEDIVDLIEENRNTFQYYVNNQSFRDKYDFEVFFEGGEKTLVINPKFFRKIKRWALKGTRLHFPGFPLNSFLYKPIKWGVGLFPDPNTAICEITFYMENTGSIVIEDWFIEIDVIGDHKPVKEYRSTKDGMPSFEYHSKNREIVDQNKITYKPNKSFPLIQSQGVSFPIELIPKPEKYDIKIHWILKARDFQKDGELCLNVEPIFKDDVEYVWVDSDSDLRSMEIISIRENERIVDSDD